MNELVNKILIEGISKYQLFYFEQRADGPKWGRGPILDVDLVVVGAARGKRYSFTLGEQVQIDVIRLGDKGPERVEFTGQIEIDPCWNGESR